MYWIYSLSHSAYSAFRQGPHVGQMNAYWTYPLVKIFFAPALWFQSPYHENFLQVDLAIVHLIQGMLIRGNEMSAIPVYSSEMKYDISVDGTVWEGYKVSPKQ